METSIVINEDGITLWTDEPARKKNLLELARENPDVVKIKHLPSDNDNNLGLRILDKKWLKYYIKKPPKLTDEQREALRIRFAKALRSGGSQDDMNEEETEQDVQAD